MQNLITNLLDLLGKLFTADLIAPLPPEFLQDKENALFIKLVPFREVLLNSRVISAPHRCGLRASKDMPATTSNGEAGWRSLPGTSSMKAKATKQHACLQNNISLFIYWFKYFYPAPKNNNKCHTFIFHLLLVFQWAQFSWWLATWW